MNKIIIAVIAVAAVVIALIAGYSLTAKQASQTAQGTVINLGTLSPNDTAIIKAFKGITVIKGGHYTFSLTNYQRVEKDFKYFAIKVSLSSPTIKKTIYLGWYLGSKSTTASLFLTPGEYNLTLGLEYLVNKSVVPVNLGNVVVEMNDSPLISVSFGIQNQPSTAQNLAFAKPVCINMGELNSGSGEFFSNSSVMSIPTGGEYLFKILHVEELEKDFETFGALVVLSNSTEEIEIPVGFSYSQPALLVLSNSIYLSPGVYKMNVSIFYNLNNSVPMSFRGTIVEVDYTPLADVNFTVGSSSQSSQLTVVQVGTGILYVKNGTAIITLHSTGSVEIEEAAILGTSYTAKMNSITPYQLTAGFDTVTINFGSSVARYIQPGGTYAIALYLSDGEVIEVSVVAQE